MSHVKIWVHAVFSTYKHQALLPEKKRIEIFRHISENAKAKGIWLDFIGGYHDHVHCLISMGKDQCIKDIMQLIKGESSHWINKQKFNYHFAWQDDYWAGSVGYKNLGRIREYIANQEVHHKKASFQEELDLLMKTHGFEQG
jgi:putative transposase